VARLGGQKEFNKLLKLHNTSKNSEERLALCAALTSFKKLPLIDQALSQITSKSVRLQDASYWLIYSFMNQFARDRTWQWLVDNWTWLEKNLGNDMSFSRFPVYAARFIVTLVFWLVIKPFQ